MTKSTYKSKLKMERALPIEKSVSKMQRKLNQKDKKLENYRRKIILLKYQVSSFSKAMMELVDKKMVSKEFFMKYIKSKKEAKEILFKQEENNETTTM